MTAKPGVTEKDLLDETETLNVKVGVRELQGRITCTDRAVPWDILILMTYFR